MLATLQDGFLVPFTGSFQNFRRLFPCLLYRSPPTQGGGGGGKLLDTYRSNQRVQKSSADAGSYITDWKDKTYKNTQKHKYHFRNIMYRDQQRKQTWLLSEFRVADVNRVRNTITYVIIIFNLYFNYFSKM